MDEPKKHGFAALTFALLYANAIQNEILIQLAQEKTVDRVTAMKDAQSLMHDMLDVFYASQ